MDALYIFPKPLIIFRRIFKATFLFVFALPHMVHANPQGTEDPGSYRQNNATHISLLQVSKFTINPIGSLKKSSVEPEKISNIIEQSQLKFTSGYDIEALTTLTDSITDLYRKEGYFLARAFIPEQSVKNDEVVINIIEGKVTEIVVENNQLYSDDTLTKPLKTSLGHPAHKDTIESAMLHLNDYPGIKANAIFSPGDVLGTARITINATEENDFQGSINVDNFGNEFTGDYRLRGRVVANNLAGFADRLQVDVLQAVSPTNSTYYALNYQLPIFVNGLSAGFAVSNNAYSVGDIFTDLNLGGSSQLIDLFGRYNFRRSLVTNLFTRFGLSLKSAESGGGGSLLETSDDLAVLYASIGISGDDLFWKGKHSGEFILSQGLTENKNQNELSLSPVTEGQFTKLNLTYSHSLSLVNSNNQFLIASMRLQYSNNVLNSLEQLPLGGPFNVRAYSVSKYLVDTGLVFNFEWLVRTLPTESLGWTKNIQLSGYFDFAYGSLNKNSLNPRILTDDGSSVTLKGIGLGLKLNPSVGYQMRFDLAYPLGKSEPTDDSGLQFLFNFGYQF